MTTPNTTSESEPAEESEPPSESAQSEAQGEVVAEFDDIDAESDDSINTTTNNEGSDDPDNPTVVDVGSDDDSVTREVAQRVFAAELNDATFKFKESDGEQVPNYVLLPTGDKANRVFIAGTLTETEDVGKEGSYWRGRIVGPTGTFFVYAGEYQPQAETFLRAAKTPMFVSVVGKPKLYRTDDGDINVSLRPEQIVEIDEADRNRWVTDTGEQTLNRLSEFNPAEDIYAEMAVSRYENLDLGKYKDAVAQAGHEL